MSAPSAVEKARALSREPGALEALRRKEDGKLVEGVLELLPDVIKQEQARALGIAPDAQLQRQLETRLRPFYRDNFGGYEEFQTTVTTASD